MVRATEEQKKEIFKLVKELTEKEATRTQIREDVFKEFGLRFCLKTIHNYQIEIFRGSWLTVLDKQEEIMDKWREEYSNNNKLTEEELYAEKLYAVATRKADPEEMPVTCYQK
jgi:hypothetical protein